MNWHQKTVYELLLIYAEVMKELVKRGIAMTANNPIGGYVEVLVCKGLGLERQPPGNRGFDGLDHNTDPPTRYQIKGRYDGSDRGHTGPLHDLGDQLFDYMVMVVVNTDFTVRLAHKIPYAVAWEFARYREKRGDHLLWVGAKVRAHPDVKDIADRLSIGID